MVLARFLSKPHFHFYPLLAVELNSVADSHVTPSCHLEINNTSVFLINQNCVKEATLTSSGLTDTRQLKQLQLCFIPAFAKHKKNL